MDDPEINRLFGAITQIKDLKERFSTSIRGAIDHALNGPVTGYYKIDQLSKSTKATIGVNIENYLRFNFDELKDSKLLDFSLGGVEFDCKYSISEDWNIPPEAFGKVCMLVSADDKNSTFKVGLLRTKMENLYDGSNQDKKRGILSEAIDKVKWIFENEKLPKNVLLHLDQDKIESIKSKDSGQKRITEFFRISKETPINVRALKTIAAPKDNKRADRRARQSREILEEEGIKILTGGESGHDQAAEAAGINLPDEWRVSVDSDEVSNFNI